MHAMKKTMLAAAAALEPLQLALPTLPFTVWLITV